MNEERDPELQALFVDAQQDLQDEAFVARVMASTSKLKLRVFAGAIATAVIALVFAWLFSVPVIDLATIITQSLATQIIAIGDSSAAWLLAPVNNLATLIVVIFKGVRMGLNKARNASYVH
ncbi:MAG: hypothetical protein O2971_18620 [Proteobacteria bacterium]|nr:hypothetical protein [Pseudomonadota bacterium]